MKRKNKDEKALRFGKVSDKPDSALAGPLPTANSEEFVPKPIDEFQNFAPPASNDIFDFIPKIHPDKYK